MKWMKMSVCTAVVALALVACAPGPPTAVGPSAGATAVGPSPPPPPSATKVAITPPAESPQSPAPVTPEESATHPPSPETTAPEPPPIDTVAPGAPDVHTAAEVRAWMKDPTAAPGKLLFLTFDDGPNHVITPKVLDALKAAAVRATFFVVGQEISKAPEVLKREVAEGNRIALHSMTHDYEALYPDHCANPSHVASEFDESLTAVRDVLGPDFSTTAWRYPGGHGSWKNMVASDAGLEARGATWLDWNALTGDAEPRKRRPTTVDAVVSLATTPITDGMGVVVLLAHDSRGKDLTLESLPRIIAAYKAAGYTFAVVS